jgi:hypothetical protein
LWATRVGILFATCLGVFVLPFLVPPAYVHGVSASNLAGFNNKVAAVAAAGLATLVFFLGLLWPKWLGLRDGLRGPERRQQGNEPVRIPRAIVAAVVVVWGSAICVFGLQIIRLGMRYLHDWGYFIDLISMHEDYGRNLYTQIEFSYGPLLFYGPVAMRAMLSPFHVSESGSFLVTLVIESVVGLLLMVYVIDHLPMSKRWKTVIFVLFALGMFVGNMGPNYTFFRFGTPLALLVMVSERRRVGSRALDLRGAGGVPGLVARDRVCISGKQLRVCAVSSIHAGRNLGAGRGGSRCIDGNISDPCGRAVFAHGWHVFARSVWIPG